MKHKHFSFLLAVLMSMVAGMASAHDFEVDGIYYNITSSNSPLTVAVTFQGGIYYSAKYSGNINIPESVTYDDNTYKVTTIGECAFYNCNITSITIPYSVKEIGTEAFSSCKELISINIPNSVTVINSFAFKGCDKLTITDFSDIESLCKMNFVDEYSNPLYYSHNLYVGGNKIEDLVIPNNVTEIGNYAFYKCRGLASISIPNSVKRIGKRTFMFCKGLTSVNIPNSVGVIGEYAFCGCEGLKSLTISNKLKYINEGTFLGCKSLVSISIPSSVTHIQQKAFHSCSGLTSVTIPDDVVYIAEQTFMGCTSIVSIHISSGISEIPRDAFSGCSSLRSITIPNNVKKIGGDAFSSCNSLTTINIGNGAQTIAEFAFSKCANLTEVNCHATNVPSTTANVFSESSIENATLYVPEESLEAYKAAVPWSGFGTKKPLSGETPNKKCGTPVIHYANGKLTFTCETEGAQFVSEITDTDIKKYYDAEVNLSVTYTIKVYATLTGYDDSDVATATLCWIEQEPTAEGLGTDVKEITSMPVLIQSQGGALRITGAANDTPISAYTVGGQLLDITTSNGGEATLRTNLHDGIVIVKVGKRTYKIAL